MSNDNGHAYKRLLEGKKLPAKIVKRVIENKEAINRAFRAQEIAPTSSAFEIKTAKEFDKYLEVVNL